MRSSRFFGSSSTYLTYDVDYCKEIIQAQVPIDTNCDKLLNPRVLRKVCHELYNRQFSCIPEGRNDIDITPYEHYVGELEMHVLAFCILDSMGGYDSIFPDIYFKVLIAELNINENRYLSAIKFLSELLA